MNRLVYVLSLMFLLCACGPSRHAIPVEMRYPSRSGIELSGKVVAVVYSSMGDAEQDMLNENMADAFAKALEEGYATGEGSVGLFCVDGRNGSYAVRDSLFNLLMTAGSDMIFLFDAPKVEPSSSTSDLVTVTLHCYDGMDKDEKVQTFSGSRHLPSGGQELPEEAADAGRKIAEPFMPQWKPEYYSIAYYDSTKWYEALMKAEQYDWKGAMDIWISLLDSQDVMKRACAEYNISVACYMLGDMALAEQWLDRSDEENKMPTLSDAMRKRIEARKR